MHSSLVMLQLYCETCISMIMTTMTVMIKGGQCITTLYCSTVPSVQQDSHRSGNTYNDRPADFLNDTVKTIRLCLRKRWYGLPLATPLGWVSKAVHACTATSPYTFSSPFNDSRLQCEKRKLCFSNISIITYPGIFLLLKCKCRLHYVGVVPTVTGGWGCHPCLVL